MLIFIYLKNDIIYLSFFTILVEWYVITIYIVLKDLNSYQIAHHNSDYILKGGCYCFDQLCKCLAQLLCGGTMARRVHRIRFS